MRYFQIFSHAYYYILRSEFEGELYDEFGHPLTYIQEVLSQRTFNKGELEDFLKMYLSSTTYSAYRDKSEKHRSMDYTNSKLGSNTYINLYKREDRQNQRLTNREWYLVFATEMYERYAKAIERDIDDLSYYMI